MGPTEEEEEEEEEDVAIQVITCQHCMVSVVHVLILSHYVFSIFLQIQVPVWVSCPAPTHFVIPLCFT